MKWEKVKLGDVIDTCLGKMLDKNKNHGVYQPYLANLNVRWGSFSLDNLEMMKFEESENERYGLKYGDLVICEGGEPGRCAVWKNAVPNMKIQKALHRVRTHQCLYNFYLYYWFLLAGKTGELEQYFTGATIKHMPAQKLREVVISLPPLPIQQRIASILSAYDELIENNQKQIKLLEEAAQRLYKEWFVDLRFPGHESVRVVDGVPEGWRKEKLVELAELKAGGDKPKIFSKMKSNICKVPIFSNGLENEGLFGYTDKADIGQESITISARGNVGYTCLRRVPYLAIVRLICVIPRKKDISTYLYFYLKHTNYNSNGSAQQQLTIPMIKNTVVCVPDENALSNFDDKVRRYFDLVDVLKYQISSLREARDRLLPKLMSGEIEV